MLGRTTPSEQFVPEPSILYLDLVNHQRLPRAGLQLLGSIIMNNRRNSRLVYGNLVPKVRGVSVAKLKKPRNTKSKESGFVNSSLVHFESAFFHLTGHQVSVTEKSWPH